jgi:AcrR family transcriptional regulator
VYASGTVYEVSSAEQPPIWARPEPPGRRGALSRSEIVRVALEIADAEGLGAVSIRRLARELGSGAMSIYHYFASRDELLELMAEIVAAEVLVPELPEDWRAALTEIARRSRAAWLKHPWLLTAAQERSTAITPNMLRHIEQSSQAVRPLAELGVDREHLTALVIAVDDYTLGYTTREAMGRGREMAGRLRGVAEEPHVRYLLESGEFPMLEQFLADVKPVTSEAGQCGDVALPDGFEQGLDWLLDGFAARLPQ